MGGWITKVIAVPTKSGDEVVNSSRTQANPKHEMMLHITRMIKFVSGPSSCGVEVSTNQEPEQQQHQEEFAKRKTRISFELHPSLILEDLLDELAEDGELFVDGDETDMDMLDLLQERANSRSVAEGTNFHMMMMLLVICIAISTVC